jgi:hypothetical protein
VDIDLIRGVAYRHGRSKPYIRWLKIKFWFWEKLYGHRNQET